MALLAPLLVALIVVPIVEVAVFIRVGEAIGLGPTLAAVVLTAVAGAALLRHQGLATLARARAGVKRNEFPAREVFDGVCLLLAGALLLTPGFVTDAIGLVLFVPMVRDGLRRALARHLAASGRIVVTETRGQRPRPGSPPVIEGEYTEVFEDDADRHRRR